MAKNPGIKITGAEEVKDNLQRIADAANASVMKRTMVFLRQIIVQRTHRGEFLNKSNAKYSTAGALYKQTSQALKRHYLSKLKGKQSDSSARFVFLERGYEQYRDIHGRQTNYVDLNYDGDMIASMNDITAKDGYASLGFLQKDEEQKARWLSEMGAGKNRVKYEFFGIDSSEEEQVADYFSEAWTEQLKEMGVIE